MNKLKIIFFALIFSAFLSMLAESSAISYTMGFAAIAVLPYVFKKITKPIDLLDPHITLSTLLYLYSLSSLVFVETFGETYYREAITPWEINTYILSCLLGITGLSIGKILLFASSQSSLHWPKTSEAYSSRVRSIIVGLGGFFFIAFIYFIKDKFTPWAATSYAEMALTVRVLSLEDQAAGIKEIATESIPLFFILGSCTVLVMTKRSVSQLLRLAGFLLLTAYIANMLLSGWRSQMMSAILMVTIYYHYTHTKLRIRSVLIGSVLVYVLINVLSVMRGSSNPIEMFMLLAKAFEQRGMDLLAISQSGELATSTNLIRLISGINNNETDFGFGSIAANQVAALVPRAIMPDRPLIASERFVQIFYPGIYESGGGKGFFILQDGYWDFGLIGVLFYTFVFAVLTQKIYQFYLQRVGHPFWTLFYGLVFYNLIFSSIRSGIFASIKSALIVALPVLLIYCFARNLSTTFRLNKDQP
jgi:oligosaccharide repeat unit polymerase